jgi:hypothetical protein
MREGVMSEPKVYPPPTMVDRKCQWCRKPFQARAVDVKRGWGRICSKSCKAKRQEKQTGQHAAYLEGRIASSAYDDFDPSWDSHKDISFL